MSFIKSSCDTNLGFLKVSMCLLGLLSYNAAKDVVHQLKLLGTVGGRSYYVETSQTLNWTDAQTYCNAAGMQLGTVETLNQAQFLNTTLYADYEDQTFWSAGREDRTHLGFVWNNNDLKPNRDLVDVWEDLAVKVYSNCVLIHAFLGKLTLAVRACADDWYVLCQK